MMDHHNDTCPEHPTGGDHTLRRKVGGGWYCAACEAPLILGVWHKPPAHNEMVLRPVDLGPSSAYESQITPAAFRDDDHSRST